MLCIRYVERSRVLALNVFPATGAGEEERDLWKRWARNADEMRGLKGLVGTKNLPSRMVSVATAFSASRTMSSAISATWMSSHGLWNGSIEPLRERKVIGFGKDACLRLGVWHRWGRLNMRGKLWQIGRIDRERGNRVYGYRKWYKWLDFWIEEAIGENRDCGLRVLKRHVDAIERLRVLNLWNWRCMGEDPVKDRFICASLPIHLVMAWNPLSQMQVLLFSIPTAVIDHQSILHSSLEAMQLPFSDEYSILKSLGWLFGLSWNNDV